MPEAEHEHGHEHAHAEHGHEHGPGCAHDHGQAEHGHVHGAGCCGHNHHDSGHAHGHGHAHGERDAMPRRMREALEKAEAKAVLNGAATQVAALPPVGKAKGNALVLFGSQTGRAEEVRRFARHAVGRTHWAVLHDPAADPRRPASPHGRWRSRSSRSSRASTCRRSACRSTSTM